MGFIGFEGVPSSMAVYERRSRLAAPLEDVWSFYTRIDGLVAVTPSWMNLRVESSRGPGGEPDPVTLEEGTRFTLSVRPFGVGPRQRWTSRIVDRERRDDAAWFRDEMIDGPFPRWIHTHRFHAHGDDTVLSDRVEYRLPAAPGPLSGLGWPFLESLFAYRHCRSRALLEADQA